MIFDGLLSLFTGAINSLLGVLPNAPVQTWAIDIGSFLSTGIGYYKGLDAHLPVTETLACAGLVLLALSATTIMRGIIWAYNLIPFAR